MYSIDFIKKELGKIPNINCLIIEGPGKITINFESTHSFQLDLYFYNEIINEISSILQKHLPVGTIYLVKQLTNLKPVNKFCVQCKTATASCNDRCKYCANGRV